MAQPNPAPILDELLSPTGQPWPAQGEWSYEDYQRLPDDARRYEIIEGVLYVTNAPGFDHQYAVSQLVRLIGNFVSAQQAGIVLAAPFEVHLSSRSRPVQPDVIFLRIENQPAAGTQIFEGAPDLIIEVLSPSTTRTDRYVKFDAYEQANVPEYWIVNPKTQSVEVYILSRGEYALLGEYIGNEPIQSERLVGIELMAGDLFGGNRP